MRFNDTLSGLLLIFFGATVALYSISLPGAAGQSIGPGAFPAIIGFGLAASGAVLIWSERGKTREAWLALETWVRQPQLALNAALVVGALIFYALAVETLGFFITAVALLTALFLAFGVRPRLVLPVALTVTVGLHVAFYSLLRVALPWGWLEAIAW
jgi:putative tricarboxylic transport membrane protein